MKVEVYFVEDEPETIAVHAISPVNSPEFTLCSIAWEEWDCGYEYKSRITDKPITCKRCIDFLNGVSIFKKTNEGWQ